MSLPLRNNGKTAHSGNCFTSSGKSVIPLKMPLSSQVSRVQQKSHPSQSNLSIFELLHSKKQLVYRFGVFVDRVRVCHYDRRQFVVEDVCFFRVTWTQFPFFAVDGFRDHALNLVGDYPDMIPTVPDKTSEPVPLECDRLDSQDLLNALGVGADVFLQSDVRARFALYSLDSLDSLNSLNPLNTLSALGARRALSSLRALTSSRALRSASLTLSTSGTLRPRASGPLNALNSLNALSTLCSGSRGPLGALLDK